MVDTGIFATTAEVQRKVGANASATANMEAYINQFIAEAENFINTVTGVDYSIGTIYTDLSASTKSVLKRWAAALAAIDVINFDTTGIGGREAETRMDVLNDEANKCQSLLKDKIRSDFVSTT